MRSCLPRGLGLIVLGILESSVWGLIQPKDAPVEPFGLAPTLFVIAAGGVLLWAFVGWQRHREAIGRDPLVHLDLLKILPLRSGLIGLFTQNLLLMGVFFTIPLYLQLVLGLDALQTGLKMLPVSIAMFAASAAGSRLSTRYSVRSITRTGLILSGIACVMLLATIKPDLADLAFAASMAVLGAGMGLMASQLGLVVQSSVDASGRGEAGGLQFTGQQLGSSLGVALIGAIVLTGLTTTFVSTIQADPRISQEVAGQVGTEVGSGIDFVSSAAIEAAAQKAGLDAATTAAIVDDYEQAQLRSLKAGLLAAALLALVSLAFTGGLPGKVPIGVPATRRGHGASGMRSRRLRPDVSTRAAHRSTWTRPRDPAVSAATHRQSMEPDRRPDEAAYRPACPTIGERPSHVRAADVLPLDRFNAFTDGVFAIAITLLVLELSVPAVGGRLLPALGEQWQEFLGYLISFVFIGGIWVSHAGMTKLMRHADTLAYGIDLLMLLFVGVLPFSTNLLVTHLSGPDVEAAVVIYGVNVLLASLCPEPAHVLHRK